MRTMRGAQRIGWARALLSALASMAAAMVGIYALLVRPWHLRWGATDAEVARAMPGDDMVERPTYVATRAITVGAPPEAIWPWLVQMGQGRGGMYSYEWIENRLMGLSIHNADRILPEFQHLQVGDTIPFGPSGVGPKVLAIDPNRSLLLGFDKGWSWVFALYPQGDGTTRLVVRNRWTTRGLGIGPKISFLALDFGDVIMEQKMLRGSAARAAAHTRA